MAPSLDPSTGGEWDTPNISPPRCLNLGAYGALPLKLPPSFENFWLFRYNGNDG